VSIVIVRIDAKIEQTAIMQNAQKSFHP